MGSLTRSLIRGGEVAGSDATMSLIQSCKDGDLEGVKAALQRGDDVNTKDECGITGFMWAVERNHNSVVALLLKTPNIDVNVKSESGFCALHCAVFCQKNDGLKLLLNDPSIDVNTVDNRGENAVHWALTYDSFEGLKLLLSHPNLTALTLNQKDKRFGNTPAMQAVKQGTLEYQEVLFADPRVDLDTTDREGKSLERAARDRGKGREKVVAKA